jgi:hypothetical protein
MPQWRVSPVPAKRVRCKRCGRLFYGQKNSIWCHDRCRYKERAENAKFETPNIPRSGIPGITYNKINKNWQIKINIQGYMKYVGSAKTLEEAIKFRDYVLEEPRTNVVRVGLS